MRDQDFYVYDIYDIDAGRYFTPAERQTFVAEYKLNHCPILISNDRLGGGETIENLLKYAEGNSELNPKQEREGLVFKCNEKSVSFKAISNKFLLKGGE
jgi:ATP-dependent RNA circularization protein (DNA/RNA ligase family)